MTVPLPIATLLTARRLEQVPADRPSAELRLARAEEKLDAARKIAAIDVEIAYVTAYDAMRIAVTPHMLSLGYRVRAVAAAHEAVGIYAEAVTNSPSTGEYQRIRRRRNRSEYDDITISTADLTADLDLAHTHADADADADADAIIQAVRGAL